MEDASEVASEDGVMFVAFVFVLPSFVNDVVVNLVHVRSNGMLVCGSSSIKVIRASLRASGEGLYLVAGRAEDSIVRCLWV